MEYTHGVTPANDDDPGLAFWKAFVFVFTCLVAICVAGFMLAAAGVAWLQPLAAFYRAFGLEVPVPFWLELMYAVPIINVLLWLGLHAYRLYRRIRIGLYYLSFSLGL